MAKTIYTKDQLSAIEERNKNILVSAQAGPKNSSFSREDT